jgi:Peptidase A4 family
MRGRRLTREERTYLSAHALQNPLRHLATATAVAGLTALLTAALAAAAPVPSTAAASPPTTAASPVRVGTIDVVRHATIADSQSDNWSGYNLGYLSTDTMYTSISGTWKVPTATQHESGQSENSATWIGIGGGCLNTSCTETDNTLIQAGTEQDVATDGAASYGAWYELIPETETAESITVNPGDTIHCSITETSPGEWDIVLKDVTDGQGFNVSTAYSSSELTAEWIEETPVVVGTSGSGIANLPNLTKVHFTAARVNGKPAGLAPADAIQLTNSSSQPIATPSNPIAAGTAFNDCAWKTTCSAP